jgi:nitroreductase
MNQKQENFSPGDILFTRRSIRKFNKGEISHDAMHYMLEAAMSAPSARNRKPWHFLVVRSGHMLQKLSEKHPYASMLPDAAMGILICGDLELEPMESYILQACSAATQNLLLAAHAIGLGAVWLGVHPREERSLAIRQIFKLPENIMPVSLIAIGLPAEENYATRIMMPEECIMNPGCKRSISDLFWLLLIRRYEHACWDYH